MITSDDFTTLPEGFRVAAEGVVVRCPVCGRNGIVETEPCGPRCVHAEKTTVLADGMLIELIDCCEVPPLR